MAKLLRKEEEQAGQEEEAETAEALEPTAEEPAPGAGADAAVSAAESEGESNEEGATPIVHWFFLPLASQPGARSTGNLLAWEATSRSGRATYFFRLVPPADAARLQDPSQAPALIDAAIRQLNRAIVLLNFRREPIYLPDASLLVQPRFRRYAIACRKLPELVCLRSSFLGRAIHTPPQAWRKQFESYLAQA